MLLPCQILSGNNYARGKGTHCRLTQNTEKQIRYTCILAYNGTRKYTQTIASHLPKRFDTNMLNNKRLICWINKNRLCSMTCGLALLRLDLNFGGLKRWKNWIFEIGEKLILNFRMFKLSHQNFQKFWFGQKFRRVILEDIYYCWN